MSDREGIVPFWIKGWIETSTGPISDSPIWFATVNLAPLIDTWDEVSETLFGLSKRIARDQSRMQDVLFPSRGVVVLNNGKSIAATRLSRSLGAQP